MSDGKEKVTTTVSDVDLAARVLFNKLSASSGKSRGQILTEFIWKAAQDRYDSQTIKRVLKRDGGIEYDID